MLFFILIFSIRKLLFLHAMHVGLLPYFLVQSIVAIGVAPCNAQQFHLTPHENLTGQENTAELPDAYQIQTQIA